MAHLSDELVLEAGEAICLPCRLHHRGEVDPERRHGGEGREVGVLVGTDDDEARR